jgi:hypothetical protein
MITVNTQFSGREDAWTFSGRSTWKEICGTLHSPMFSNPRFDRGEEIPNTYADYTVFDKNPEMRYRWEHAYPTIDFFTDIDASITLQQYYSAASGCGIIFHALDSVRCYSVEVVDMGRKGPDYRVALLVSDASGYSTELAVGFAPHSIMADEYTHGQFRDREGWEHTSPESVTLQVKTTGAVITVFMDGIELFTVQDDTYRYGATGISACVNAPIKISGYQLQAEAIQAPATREQWEDANYANFVKYPIARHRVGGWYGHPLLHRAPNGEIIMVFNRTQEGPPATGRGEDESPAVTYSVDDGKTWSEPRIIAMQKGLRISGTVMGHTDGSWSFIGKSEESIVDEQKVISKSCHIRMHSINHGENWSEMEEMEFEEKKVHEFGWDGFYLYSAPFRLSNGNVLMTGYIMNVVSGADTLTNDTRRDQSFVVRSTDDGHTWGAPILMDTTKFDTNECMIGEPEPGRLVSFSRTLRARFMWSSTSTDGGLTWSDLIQSSVSGECPNLISHSSGAIVMTSRGNIGNSVIISFDYGVSWTRMKRVTPCGMATMAELSDGRILIAGHTGWNNPTWIHTDTFRVTPDGPVAER